MKEWFNKNKSLLNNQDKILRYLKKKGVVYSNLLAAAPLASTGSVYDVKEGGRKIAWNQPMTVRDLNPFL